MSLQTSDEETRQELACWAHARRKYWEAATAKNTIAREGLYRIQRLFELETRWKRKAPAEIKRMREAFSRPHLDAFVGWVSEEYEKVKGCRELLESAWIHDSAQGGVDALCGGWAFIDG